MTSRVAIPQRQPLDDAWKNRGICKKIPNPDLFFVPDEERARGPRTPIEEAVMVICARCPVSGNCLDWALKMNEVGIWGGTTTRERRTIKRVRVHGRCVRCLRGRSFINRLDNHTQACMSCGLSWLI